MKRANKRRRRRGHRMDPASNVGDPGNGPRFYAAHGWVPTEQRRAVKKRVAR